MQALLLGGTGFSGGSILKRFGNDGPIRSVRVASRKLERAERAASGSPCPATALHLDIGDAAAVEAAASEVDIILNAAGRAIETAPTAIRAALTTGTPYVDLSAEVDVTLQAEELIARLGAPRVPIVLGAGVHPGFVELLGCVAARELDAVSAVDMFLIAALEDYGAPEHFLPLFEGGWNGTEGLQTMCKMPALSAVQVTGGRRDVVRPAEALRSFSSLDGVTIDGFAMASAEPLSLHRALGGETDYRMTMAFWPPAANRIACEKAEHLMAGAIPFAPVMKAMWSEIKNEAQPRPRVHFWAVAQGSKDGKQATATAFCRQDWANQQRAIETTAGVFAYTAEAVARGDVGRSGILSPVELFDPDHVFRCLAAPDDPEVQVIVHAQ